MAITNNGEKHPPKFNNKVTNFIAILITFHSVAFGFYYSQES